MPELLTQVAMRQCSNLQHDSLLFGSDGCIAHGKTHTLAQCQCWSMYAHLWSVCCLCDAYCTSQIMLDKRSQQMAVPAHYQPVYQITCQQHCCVCATGASWLSLTMVTWQWASLQLTMAQQVRTHMHSNAKVKCWADCR